jgi:hypothetical protein
MSGQQSSVPQYFNNAGVPQQALYSTALVEAPSQPQYELKQSAMEQNATFFPLVNPEWLLASDVFYTVLRDDLGPQYKSLCDVMIRVYENGLYSDYFQKKYVEDCLRIVKDERLKWCFQALIEIVEYQEIVHGFAHIRHAKGGNDRFQEAMCTFKKLLFEKKKFLTLKLWLYLEEVYRCWIQHATTAESYGIFCDNKEEYDMYFKKLPMKFDDATVVTWIRAPWQRRDYILSWLFMQDDAHFKDASWFSILRAFHAYRGSYRWQCRVNRPAMVEISDRDLENCVFKIKRRYMETKNDARENQSVRILLEQEYSHLNAENKNYCRAIYPIALQLELKKRLVEEQVQFKTMMFNLDNMIETDDMPSTDVEDTLYFHSRIRYFCMCCIQDLRQGVDPRTVKEFKIFSKYLLPYYQIVKGNANPNFNDPFAMWNIVLLYAIVNQVGLSENEDGGVQFWRKEKVPKDGLLSWEKLFTSTGSFSPLFKNVEEIKFKFAWCKITGATLWDDKKGEMADFLDRYKLKEPPRYYFLQ